MEPASPLKLPSLPGFTRRDFGFPTSQVLPVFLNSSEWEVCSLNTSLGGQMDTQNCLENGVKGSFQSAHRGAIRTVGIVGAGDVVRERIGRALAEGCSSHLEVAICSRENVSPISSLRHQYFPTFANNSLPLDELDRAGFLGDQVLWIVATPSDLHVPYTLQLA